MRNLDLDLLRTLVAIADHDTFGAAAETVQRTQSAVTQQMQRLEEQLGLTLFERQGVASSSRGTARSCWSMRASC